MTAKQMELFPQQKTDGSLPTETQRTSANASIVSESAASSEHAPQGELNRSPGSVPPQEAPSDDAKASSELVASPEETSCAEPATLALAADDPLTEALQPFRKHMERREFAVNTIKSFGHDLGLLVDFMGERATLRACSPTKLDAFIEYLRVERDVPCSLKSLDRRITTLKVFFGWLASAGVLASDPAAGLIHHGATSPLPRILSEVECEAVLAVTRDMRDAAEAPDARPHLLISLLLATGIKKAECMRIALDHLRLDHEAGPAVYIHYEKPRQQFKSRLLALAEDWPQTWALYVQRYQPTERVFECTARNLEYMLHNLSTVVGLNHHLTFDELRWTSAVNHYRQGMGPDRLRRRLGLSKIAWREALPIIIKLAEGPL